MNNLTNNKENADMAGSFSERPLSPVPQSYPWVPDQGDGTYRNPVIHADYSDPDVIRVGDDYWLVSSSFNCTPGLPILHSRDLVNWTIVGHAIKNLPHERFDRVQPGHGVWAPAIRHHNGWYWIFFPMPDEGIYVTTAKHPTGEWSKPYLVVAGKGLIDPCPLWDDDGSAYLVHAYANSRAGIKDRLRICPMASDCTRLLGEGEIIIHEPERHPLIEGPKFLKKDGWYYVFAPAGSVRTGWQVVLRSKHIYGPYDDRIVIEQGTTQINGPHQGAIVDDPEGNWWFVHFQDAGLYGRIVHLQPVAWKNGWPVIGEDFDENGIGEPVAQWRKPACKSPNEVASPATSDEFRSKTLGLQWQWNANHSDDWCRVGESDGVLRLISLPTKCERLALVPNILCQKFPARSFRVDVTLDLHAKHPGEQAGVVVLGKEFAALYIQETGHGFLIALKVNDQIVWSTDLGLGKVRLSVEVRDGGMCEYSYSPMARFGDIAIGHKFQAMQGVWIGARIGVFAIAPNAIGPGGWVDIDEFQFSGLNSDQ